jgi:hypothetical protein
MHGLTIATEPANGIRVRGRCEIAPSQPPIASRAFIVHVGAGLCHLTHLGTVRVEVEQQLNVVLGTQTAQLTLTTPDGSQLWLSSVGDSEGSGRSLRFNGAARAVGGTGPFASAIGAVRTDGDATSGGGRNRSRVLKIDGWIAYQGTAPRATLEDRDRWRR